MGFAAAIGPSGETGPLHFEPGGLRRALRPGPGALRPGPGALRCGQVRARRVWFPSVRRAARMKEVAFFWGLSQIGKMADLAKSLIVARYEWLDALRSRLVLLWGLLYGGGALLGSRIFLGLLQAAEQGAREALGQQLGKDPAELPDSLIRERVIPWLMQFVEDPQLRSELVRIDPLSLFYGFATLHSVPLLVLVLSSGSIVGDVSGGAARYVLFRCGRLSWVLGKLLGQAALLAAGLLMAAGASALVAWSMSYPVTVSSLTWLARMAFRSWVYGCAYLGLFGALSMVAQTPLRVRVGALSVWFAMTLGYWLLTTEGSLLQAASALAWLIPAHHRAALWSGEWISYLWAVGSLLAIAALATSIGYRGFRRRDV